MPIHIPPGTIPLDERADLIAEFERTLRRVMELEAERTMRDNALETQRRMLETDHLHRRQQWQREMDEAVKALEIARAAAGGRAPS
jgi:hypothetical protein